MTTPIKRRALLYGLAGTAFLASRAIGPAFAAAPAGSPAAGQSLRVVATTAIVGDIVANVMGETGQVEWLMGEGVDPHLYKITRADLSRLVGADIVFYSGLLLEGKMTDVLQRIAEAGKPVIAVTDDVDAARLLGSADYAGQFDPHVWMDVALWSQTVPVVRDELSRLRPDQASAFQAGASTYLERLEALEAYVRRILSSVSPERRVLVTAHDAFGYFGRAYGFEVLGIQGLSTESEAGVRRIAELVDLLVERRIPAVFVETTVSERNVRALIEGARSRGHEVAIGGALFSDAMGPAGTYEGTYEGMIDHNATTIARALGGDAPAGGLSGRLAAR